MLLQYLRDWQPFKIDALGIVTLLGAEEMNLALGSLIKYRFTEYLPLLGAYVVANNNIMAPKPGFVLYNVSDGIMAIDVAGWFCRWLLSQQISWNSTSLHFTSVDKKPIVSFWSRLLALRGLGIGTVTIGAMTTIALLSNDWWAFANAVSMFVSVVTRQIMTREARAGIDRVIQGLQGRKSAERPCKALVLTPSGAAVTIYAPRGIITDVLLTNPSPPHGRLYQCARIMGWAGFGCHVVTLGMSSLANQIIAVVALLMSSILTAYEAGSDPWHIGSGD
ncbi:uncharacterized protein CDV56_102888 [Aspergillus thermomutatus]|uniref:Uncharacterized protein n=1 Tax=Aspergillus thermomutatus TaxID=41047 RepID=A0A397G2A8_ASPTH|nr:uncharacterized protein CDV56_102888 [Aspergillus thermomutatus]RHZ43688.1 hypothetical protein CDV56_102888 [Aspergillus thermomutatus]